MRARAALLATLSCACACATSARPAAETTTAPPEDERPVLPEGMDPNRVLGPSATFGDLVRAARAVVERGQGDSSAACLLHEGRDGFALGADLMPAISGAGEGPSELDARLQAGGRVAALTAFGVHGAAGAPDAIEAWTAVPPERLVHTFALIALTDEGVYVRHEPPEAGATAGAAASAPMPLAAFARALAHGSGAASPVTCYVTAEPGVALEAFGALLSQIPASCQAVLGTVLPAGTRLPAPPTAVEPPRCPEGLPELPAIAVTSELPVPALREGLSAIAPGARRCLQYAAADAARGIAIRLALRIDPRGEVERVCVLDASVRAASFESCVLEAARGARFTAPSPAGYVDVHAPLSLVAEPWPVQRPLCGDSRN